jgi:aspartate kinase
VAADGIVVDTIVQNRPGPGRVERSFSVLRGDLERALASAGEAVRGRDPGTRVGADGAIAKLIVSGAGIRTHAGAARRMFGALAKPGSNISMINTSDVRLSVLINQARGEEALACPKEAFHLA